MMFNSLKFAVAAIVSCSTFSVTADDSKLGLYFIGGINSIRYDTAVRELDSAQGFDLGFGSQLNENWSAEIKYSSNNAERGFGVFTDFLQLTSIYRINETHNNSLFWKMGVGSYIEGTSNVSSVLGLGYEVNSSPNVSFSFGVDSQYQINNSALDWVPYASIKYFF